MKDPNPRMRIQAIRASETLYKAANRSFADDYRAMTRDADPDVALQALLTANLFKLPDIETLIKNTQASSSAKGVQEIGRQILQRIATAATTAAAGFSTAQQEQLKEGETVYKTLCFSCHGDDGRGITMAGAAEGVMMAPALAGSPRVQGHRDYVINTLLHGMTGPIAGQTFSQVKTSPLVTLKASLRAAGDSPDHAIARASRSTSTACETREAPPGKSSGRPCSRNIAA